MTPQSTFMITAPIKVSQVDALRDLLASMNSAPGFADSHNSLIPWWQFSNVHVARFTILEANTNDDLIEHGQQPGIWPKTLCFIGDIDGDSQRFLAELVIRAAPGLRKIFAHCEGFHPQGTDLLDWLHRHSHRSSASYVNWLGRTAVQVREEAALHNLLRQRFDASPGLRDKTYPRQVWLELKHFVQSEIDEGRFKLTPPAPAPAGWVLRNTCHMVGVPLALIALAPLFVLAAPFYFYRLRQLEREDHENILKPSRDHLRALVAQEDIDVTNHFNVFGP